VFERDCEIDGILENEDDTLAPNEDETAGDGIRDVVGVAAFVFD
jgi:hypothetical protein